MESFLTKFYEWAFANWKTFSVGLVGAVTVFLVQFGIDLSPELQAKLSGWIFAAGLFFLGLFAKDAGKEPPAE